MRLHTRDLLDRAVAADPGLLRLQTAGRAVGGVGIAMALEWVLAPALAVQSIVAMLMGGMVAMMGAFGVAETTPVRNAVTVAGFPLATLAGLAPGAVLDGHRLPSLIGWVVVMVVAVLVRRFGIRWFIWGQLAWIGYFFSLFTHVPASHLPDLFVVVLVASAATALVLLVVLPDRRQAVIRSARKAFRLRVRNVAAASSQLVLSRDADGRPGPQQDVLAARLHGAMLRLNEAALVLDAHLSLPGALPPGGSAHSLRQQLLDAELAADDLALAVLDTGQVSPPGPSRDDERHTGAAAIAAIVAISHGDRGEAGRLARATCAELADRRRRIGSLTPVELAWQRAAVAVLAMISAAERAQDAVYPPAGTARTEEYQTPVGLFGANLQGSREAAEATLAQASGRFPWHRWSLNTRQAVQVGVASSVAIAAGDALSPTRYYWAVLAVFLAFTGTSTTGETLVKAAQRVTGTVAGLAIALLLVNVTAGHDSAVVGVVLVAVFAGLYFIRVNYAVMSFAVTTVITQLYVVLHEFTDHLLLLRFAETALGAVVGTGTALLVLPTRGPATRAAAREALLRDLGQLLEATRTRIEDPAAVTDLPLAARRVDSDLRQVLLVDRPSAGPTLVGLGRVRSQRRIAVLTSITTMARRLTRAEALPELSPGVQAALASTCLELQRTVAVLRHPEPGRRCPVPPPLGDSLVAAGPPVFRLSRTLDRMRGGLVQLCAGEGMTPQVRMPAALAAEALPVPATSAL